jgi:hypothetical protein
MNEQEIFESLSIVKISHHFFNFWFRKLLSLNTMFTFGLLFCMIFIFLLKKIYYCNIFLKQITLSNCYMIIYLRDRSRKKHKELKFYD